jgi:hypothetical protein
LSWEAPRTASGIRGRPAELLAAMDKTAERTALREFVDGLRARGFEARAVVSDEEMAVATEAFHGEEGVLDTPAEELRYIEGLLALPMGHIERFSIIPASGHDRCACGRVPSALDLVATALRRRIHDRDTVRETVLGLTNLVELADGGRAADCFSCGRRLVSRSYWTNRYMYA